LRSGDVIAVCMPAKLRRRDRRVIDDIPESGGKSGISLTSESRHLAVVHCWRT
jgi:hypothetical protein